MVGAVSRSRFVIVLGAVVFATSGCAWLARSSEPRAGLQTSGLLSSEGISASGRYALFSGDPYTYLTVPLSTNGQALLRDNTTKTTEIVSVATDGTVANAPSGGSGISDDGRYVAFSSAASNLAAGDTDGNTDAFIRDRTNHTTTLVSLNNDGSQITDLNANACAMSGDGNVVVLCLRSPGVAVPPAVSELAVRNLRTGTTLVLPHLHDAPNSSSARLSGDGSLVAYGDITVNPNTIWLGIARTDTGALVRDLGSASLAIGNSSDVHLSADGTTYALTEGQNEYNSLLSTGTVTVGRVDGSTPPVVHHYRWAAQARLSRDGSVLAVEILLASGLQVLAIDRGADPPLVVSADTTGTKIVAADGDIQLSADGKWVAFVSNQTQTLLGGAAPDGSSYDVYTRSVAQKLDPPS